MIAYVSRELRKQQARIAKMPEKKTTPLPSVNVSELRHLFPQLPEHLIRQRLKDRCDCQPRYVRSPLSPSAAFSGMWSCGTVRICGTFQAIVRLRC